MAAFNLEIIKIGAFTFVSQFLILFFILHLNYINMEFTLDLSQKNYRGEVMLK